MLLLVHFLIFAVVLARLGCTRGGFGLVRVSERFWFVCVSKVYLLKILLF